MPVGTFPSIPSMISVVGLLLQSQGRVILGGDQDTTHGVLVGLAPISFVDGNGTSTPIFDASFGADGRFTNPNINSMHSFAIDNNNRIVVGFVALDGITVSLARVRQHASGLDTNFHNTGLIATNITTAVGIKPVKVALDNDNKIVVATTTSTGISVRRYDDTGATEDVGLNITNSALALTAPVITQLLTTITNQIILLGYENINNGNMFAIRLTSDGLLDTTFNPAPASIPGILKYQIHTGDNVHRLYAGAIAQDGRIVAIGYEDVA